MVIYKFFSVYIIIGKDFLFLSEGKMIEIYNIGNGENFGGLTCRNCCRQCWRNFACSTTSNPLACSARAESVDAYGLSASASRSHSAADASLGMRQSPRGDSVTEPTFGPSGRQLRLNCWEKKRR